MRASLSLLLLVSACAEPPAELGTVSVALVTTGSDGATYRLPAGSVLQLSSATFFDEYSLDGATTSVSLETPLGTYDAQLLDAAGDIPSVWSLERIGGDGSVTTVPATLLTTMPASVTVTDTAPADLVLTFRTAGGTITFTHGTLEVSLDVSSVTATSGAASWNAALSVDSVTTSPTAPPAVVAALPAAGATGLGVTVTGRQTGPWYQSASRQVCTTLTLDAADGLGSAGLDDLITEATAAGTADLCVYDDGATRFADLFLFRVGAPSTGTFSGLGSGNLYFLASISVELPAAVFDGETLDLDALAGRRDLPGSAFLRVRPNPGPPQSWYVGRLSGTVTFDFQPLP